MNRQFVLTNEGKEPVADDVPCQICRKTRPELNELSEGGSCKFSGDPMHQLDMRYNNHELGTLVLCWMCSMGVHQTFQAPVYENEVDPMRAALLDLKLVLEKYGI